MSSARSVFLLVALVAGYMGDAESSTCPHVKYSYFTDHTACKTKSASAVTIEFDASLKQQIVDRHNYWRGQADPPATDMMKMYWDDELAMIAQKWADACDDRPPNYLEHDTARFIPGRFSVGQNLADTHNFMVQIDGWYNEKPLYDFGQSFFNQTNDFAVWLHYTLMMWANSHKIGCAATDCSGHEVFVCNYAPMGNTIDFFHPYTPGTQCAECQTCVDGLCDCGAGFTCDIGQPNSQTCGCDCADTGGYVPAFLQQPDCHLNCTAGREDVYFCGVEPWAQKKDCPGIHWDCPWMCNVCPYADDDYDGPMPVVNTETSGDSSCSCIQASLMVVVSGILLIFSCVILS